MKCKKLDNLTNRFYKENGIGNFLKISGILFRKDKKIVIINKSISFGKSRFI